MTTYQPVDGETTEEIIGNYAATVTAYKLTMQNYVLAVSGNAEIPILDDMESRTRSIASRLAEMKLVITDMMIAEGVSKLDTGKVTATLEPFAGVRSGYLAHIERNGEAI